MAQTAGLIQRLKWVDDSQAIFVYLGPTPSAVQLFFISFASADLAELATRRAIAHLLLSACAADLLVAVTHEEGSVEITGADTRHSAIRLDAMEATQSIQDLRQSVALLQLKTTIVRVYMSYRSMPPVQVRGEISLRRPPSASTQTITSLNTVTLDASQFGNLNVKRLDVQGSLNFQLPIDQTATGPLEISLRSITDASTGEPLDAGLPSVPWTIEFETSPPLRVRILGISYEFGDPPMTISPTALDFDLMKSWLRRAYPVAQVISSQAIVPASMEAEFTCGQANAQVAAIRALDVAGGVDNRTHYYGLVGDGNGSGFFMRGCAAVPSSPDPTAVGSGPTGPGTWGWDFDGSYGDWYAGHELGHTFGRRHPGFCGESNDDAAYPFDRGQLSNADDAFVGFDVGDAILGLPMVVLPGTEWRDVMTYCQNQWLSSYTYGGIRARLQAEDALGPTSLSSSRSSGRPDERYPTTNRTQSIGNLVSVVAIINLSKNEGKIEHVNPLPRGEVSQQDPNSSVILQVKNENNQVLDSYSLGVKPLSDQDQGSELALLDAVIPVVPSAKSLELLIGGKSEDIFQADAVPQPVRNLRESRRDSAELMLEWETEVAQNENQTYIVQASTDRGRTWWTLAVGLRNPQAIIDREQFKGQGRPLIRVIATNGFSISEVNASVLDFNLD